MSLFNDMKNFDSIIRHSVSEALENTGIRPKRAQRQPSTQPARKPNPLIKKSRPAQIAEALVITPKALILKTEKLSAKTKEMLEVTYKSFVDAFNKIDSQLDSTSKADANSISSPYRTLSTDRTNALNATKLFELYFSNISDLNSQINTDALPYMRLARDFGTFDQWQFDFIAACMSSRNGWAMVVYDPYKNVYMNAFTDNSNYGIPVGAIPILVMNINGNLYSRDYGLDRKSYVVAMMREINWSVVEARMTVVEQANLSHLWSIVPLSHTQPNDAQLTQDSEDAMQTPIEAEPTEALVNAAIAANTRASQ